MRLKTILLTSIMLIFINLVGHAQTNKLTGNIQDGGNQAVIDAASVSLLRAKDSSLVKIALTDKEGKFSFDNVKTGKYLVMATSSGHKKTYSSTVEILEGATVSVGTLQLIEAPKSLKEVIVTSKKPFIERKIDKTVINVDAMISNSGTTALEVLEKAPGVSVDKDGKISLKGKQSVIIMMDGKPAYLSGQDLANLLKNMPSSNIEQIEIMTNPSAKYDAAGNSGIINLKTKKNKVKGFNGSLSTTYGQTRYSRTNNSVNVNYRQGKVNLFGNYNYSMRNSYDDLTIHRNFKNVTTNQLETVFEQNLFLKNHSEFQSLKAGMDLYATKKTTLGVVLSGYLNPRSHKGDNTTNLKNAQGITDSLLVATSSNKSKVSNLGANFNLRHIFDSTGKEVTMDLDYINYDQRTKQMFVNNYLNADMTKRKASSELRGQLPANVKIYSAKADYTHPLKKGIKLETGVKSSYVVTDNDALYENNTTGGWVTDLGKTNHFIYKENINAAYVNLNKQIKKWGVQAGLRLENTNANGHQAGNTARPDSNFTRHYTNLFPTVFVSYEADKKNTFSVNYGRRIDRPDYEDLNPFYYFLDEYTYQVGNTLLRPQFTDAIELSHTFKGFLTTTVNYSNTKDVFADVLDQITSERKTFVSKDNIATKKNLGVAVSLYTPVTKIWTTNIYANANYNKYSGALNGGVLNVKGTTVMTNISNQFKFKKGWSAELSGWYRTKGIEGQIVANPMWQVTTAVAKQVLKNKGTVKFSLRDVFNSQQFKGSVQYQDIDVYIMEKNDRRVASLTFSYRFGKPMQQKSRKTGGAGDEQSRIKSGQ